MKLRNFAFFGVMASILGVNGAYAADTTTVIASQAYVDAHKNNADMHVDTASKTNWNSAYTATDGAATSNALTETDGTKLTKVSSIKGMLTTTVGATGEDTKVPTEKAVRAAIAAVDVSGAVSDGDNALILDDADNKAPSVNAVKGMVTTGVGETGVDTKVPTEKAVRTAIKEATTIAAATVSATNNEIVTGVTTQNGSVTGVSSTLIKNANIDNNAGIADSKIAFTEEHTKALDSGIDTVKVAQITTNANDIADLNTSKQNVSESTVAQDGNYIRTGTNVAANLGLLDTQVKTNENNITSNSTAIGTLNNLSTSEKSNLVVAINEVVEGLGEVADNAVAKNDDITASATHSIVTYDEKGLVTGGINLNNRMHDINNATADATCSETNPCVLSYLGDTKGYRWTAMDLDGLSVDGGGSSN